MNIKKAKKESKSLTTQQRGVFTDIKNRENSFSKLLPPEYNSSKFVNHAMIALQNNQNLLQCKPGSIIKALLECAAYGLEPNTPMSYASLVPYGDKVEFMIEYRGLMKLAWNTGRIKKIDYGVINSNEKYEYRVGDDSYFVHYPKLIDAGEPIAYYALASLTTGATIVHVMTIDEILKHGKRFSRSFAHKTSPWQTDFKAMAIKTVMRQLCDKKLPKDSTSNSILLQKAAHHEDIPYEDRESYIETVVEETQTVEEKPKRKKIIIPLGDKFYNLMHSIKQEKGDFDKVKSMLFNILGQTTIDSDQFDSLDVSLQKKIIKGLDLYMVELKTPI